ncbi:MAG: S8 family serine peptidase [Vicinamibacterales bacterium]
MTSHPASSSLLGRARRVLSTVVVLAASAVASTPAHASDDKFVLQLPAGQLATVLSRHGLGLVESEASHDLHRVRDLTGHRSTNDILQELAGDKDVAGFELDGAHVLVEQQPNVSLTQSSAAILETIQNRAPVAYFGATVLNRYADQPATRLIGLASALTRSTGDVIVAIIDTGVDPNHPALRNVLVAGYDFVRGQAGLPSELADLDQSSAAILEQSSAAILEQDRAAVLNQSTAAFLDQSSAAILETHGLPAAFGHGTMVAGLVHLVAPTARIMPLKAFSASGTSSLYDIARAVYFAVDHGARVVNMSFSMSTESKELVRAITYAKDHGVICVSSVGNRGESVKIFPAASSDVLGVASTSDVDARSTFSNYGSDSVTLAAPGEGVTTTYPGPHYASAWGTSFSTGLVSGAVALLSRNGQPAVNDSKIALDAIIHARKLSSELGKGRLDLVEAFLARDAIDSQGGGHGTDDNDGDGMPLDYELDYGLDGSRNDANEDPDHDGVTNIEEYRRGTHPRGFSKVLFAEGATGAFFSTRFACVNTGTSTALALLTFQKNDGTTVTLPLKVSGNSRRTVEANNVPGLESAEFSTLVESDVSLVCDRTMSWGAEHYGSHAETGIDAHGSSSWYLAEGSTLGGFQLFYLLQNPTDQPTVADVTFLLPAPLAPVTRSYALAPHSRTTVWVNAIAELAHTDVSAAVASRDTTVPIVVERSMYLDVNGRQFKAGHESAGLTTPATTWHLAEGATGAFFDTFVLVANSDSRDADLEVTYLLPDGTTIVKSHRVPARSRSTYWVDYEDDRLRDTAVSTTITSTNGVPVIVERAMWWPGTSATWYEAHASAGAPVAGKKWAMGDGECGGLQATQTYILVANISPRAATVTVTLLFEGGTTATRTFTVAPSSRFNVDVANDFPEARGHRFGATVESTGANPADIIVERAMYGDALGLRWSSGSDSLAAKLR